MIVIGAKQYSLQIFGDIGNFSMNPEYLLIFTLFLVLLLNWSTGRVK